MTPRDNYKTKWLNALAANQTAPSIAAAETTKTLDTVKDSQVNTTIELNKVHSTLMAAAAAAKTVCQTMDSCSRFGGLDFGESTHGIDGKLGSMNLNIMARRIRDVLLMADARIGFLSVVCEDLTDANSRMTFDADILKRQNEKFVSTAVETLYIGKNPTQNEIEDYSLDDRRSSHPRFEHRYVDLSSDWLDTKLTSYDRSNQAIEDEAESDDSADDEPTTLESQLQIRPTQSVSKTNPVRNAPARPNGHRNAQNITL